MVFQAKTGLEGDHWGFLESAYRFGIRVLAFRDVGLGAYLLHDCTGSWAETLLDYVGVPVMKGPK